jgi:6-phosphogluconolactonase
MTSALSEDWVEAAAARVADAMARAAAEADDGVARVAVAGGTTPAPVYRRLVDLGRVDWTRVLVYFGDERCVPPDHPESNYRMVRENLLDPAGLGPSQVFPMDGGRLEADAAAAEYADLLPEPLAVLILGIGEDGHTASLFPGSPALEERTRQVVAVAATVARRARITITPRVITGATRVLVLARGTRKAPAVARALGGAWDPGACPAQLARHGTWLVDPEAAADLPPGSIHVTGTGTHPRA